MKKRKIIWVIEEKLEEAREKSSLVYSLLQQLKWRNVYSVLPEVANHQTTIARCRNLEPTLVFLARSLVLKKEFGDLVSRIKTVCPKNTQIFVFDTADHLRQVVTDKFRKRG